MPENQYTKRKKQGLCVYCGKRPAVERRVKCSQCLADMNSKQKEYAQREDVKLRIVNVQQAYREANREKLREYFKESWKNCRIEAIKAYGGECVCCGEDNFFVLELDHINDDGQEDRLKHGGYVHWMKTLKRRGYPNNIQVLCSNCHSKKKANKAKENSAIKGHRFYNSPYRDAAVAYGAKCSCCGFNDLDCLELHHINGGGRLEIESKGGWRAYFKQLKEANYPKEAGLRVLCANCHTCVTKGVPCVHIK